MPDWIILLFMMWGLSMVIGRRGGCSWRGRSRDRWLDETDSPRPVSYGSMRDQLPRSRESEVGARVARRDQTRVRRSPAGSMTTATPEGSSRKRPAQSTPARRPAESPMQLLQRRFVDGSLTVEEYERELDRLLRRR